MRSEVLLVILLLLLPGCLGRDDAPVESASLDEDGATANTEGLTARANGASAAVSDGATNTTAAPVVVPIAFEGSLPVFAETCVFSAVMGRCDDVTPGEFHNRFDVDAEGNVTSVMITLTWTPSSPATEKLGAAFFSFSDSDFVRHGGAFGTSPLVLEIPLPVTLEPGWTHRLGVGVGSYAVSPDPAFVGVAANPVEQTFTLTGELAIVPP